MECSRRKCWRRKRYRINRKSGENREMIRWRAVGGRERWGEWALDCCSVFHVFLSRGHVYLMQTVEFETISYLLTYGLVVKSVIVMCISTWGKRVTMSEEQHTRGMYCSRVKHIHSLMINCLEFIGEIPIYQLKLHSSITHVGYNNRASGVENSYGSSGLDVLTVCRCWVPTTLTARAGVGGCHGGHVRWKEADDDSREAASVAVARRRGVGTKTVTGRRNVDEHRHQHGQTWYTTTVEM